MTASTNKLERTGIGLVLFAALLTFFSPLVGLRGPVAGEEFVNGSNVRAKLDLLQSSLKMTSAAAYSRDRRVPTGAATESPALSEPPDVPLSLRIAWLTPLLIFAALACAGLALLGLFFFRKATTALGLAGGCFGALAVVHVLVMSSDLRSWVAGLIGSGSLGSAEDQFAAMRALMVNSFEVSPGPGLYSLTACLFLAAFLSSTGAIPRIRSVLRRSPRVKSSQPIRVRPVDSRYPEEACTTLDTSEDGLYFESAANHYYAGMEVYITHEANSGSPANREERGNVVRVQNLESGKFGVSIHIISAVQEPVPALSADH
jgi:hypothetical protein